LCELEKFISLLVARGAIGERILLVTIGQVTGVYGQVMGMRDVFRKLFQDTGF